MIKGILKHMFIEKSSSKTIALSLTRGKRLSLLVCYLDIVVTFIFAVVLVRIIIL